MYFFYFFVKTLDDKLQLVIKATNVFFRSNGDS